MVQPIGLLMSHFNVEHNVQTTPNALAAAQDTAQGQEIVRDGIRVAQTVQASEAAAEAQRVHRRSEDEEREGRRQNSRDTFQRSGSSDREKEEKKEGEGDSAFTSRMPPSGQPNEQTQRPFDVIISRPGESLDQSVVLKAAPEHPETGPNLSVNTNGNRKKFEFYV